MKQTKTNEQEDFGVKMFNLGKQEALKEFQSQQDNSGLTLSQDSSLLCAKPADLISRKQVQEMKIIKDEFCQCGHSKKAHLPHELDVNGGRCAICFKCDCYTWKRFEFYSKEELNQELQKIR